MTKLDDAISYHQTGQLDKAKEIYLELLKENSNSTTILNLLGVLYLKQQKYDEAEKFIKKAMELEPNTNTAYNLGLIFYGKSDFKNAAKYFEQSIEDENDTDLIKQIASCYEKANDNPNTLKYYLKLNGKYPKNLEYIRKLATLFNADNDTENALKFYLKSFELDKKDHIACTNLGSLYEKLNDTEKAKEFYKKSFKLKPNYEAYHNLGILLRKQKKYNDSISCLQQALKLKPNDPKTELSLGMSYLIIKDFKNGFLHYRNKRPELKKRYHDDWDGKHYNEATALVYCGGGFGDYIMFSRYLPMLKNYFKETILQVPKELEKLINMNFPDFKTSSDKDEIAYNKSICMIDLPYLLNMDIDDIPDIKYTYDKAKAAGYKEKYFNTDKQKIGIFFKGNQNVFKNRSIPLKEMSSLFSLNNCKFYSFQKNDEENQLEQFKQELVDLGTTFEDFSDTASALVNLDVLVTIDSGIAHLAGALGVRTFLMLPYANEWRWFDDAKTTPWYKSIELFRQKEEGNWHSVINEIYNKLK